jgi:hypothetical protein
VIVRLELALTVVCNSLFPLFFNTVFQGLQERKVAKLKIKTQRIENYFPQEGSRKNKI